MAGNETLDKKQRFLSAMRDFPCTFNLGQTNLDLGRSVFDGKNIREPVVADDFWEYYQNCSQNNDEDDLEDPLWEKNLLTRANTEMGGILEAKRLNTEVIEESNNQNLVSRANAAFLYFLEGDFEKASEIVDSLKGLKRKPEFEGLKVGALLEQGYYYKKLCGATNNLSARDILSFLHKLRPKDERIAMMLALVCRRCTHSKVLGQEPERINIRDFTLEAAKYLQKLISDGSNSTKAIALVELAFLKRTDEYSNYKTVSREEWHDIIGEDDSFSMCEKAVKMEGVSRLVQAKVLRNAGQIMKSKNEDLGESCLKKSIEIQPSCKAYHHLALLYKKKAIRREKWKIKGQSHPRGRSQTTRTLEPRTFEGRRHKPVYLDDRLRCIEATTAENMKQFGKRNDEAQQACDYYKLAVDIDNGFNFFVVCEYAEMLGQTGSFDDAIQYCEKIIDKCQQEDVRANAYHIMGMCFGIKAREETEESQRKELVERAEHMLLQAVRAAATQVETVPELPKYVNTLWETIRQSKSYFQFVGDWDSMQLFKLCKLLADYRFLPAVDHVLSLSDSVWSNDSALLEAFKSQIVQGDLNGALLLLDMIPLRPEAKYLSWHKSDCVSDIKEVAKRGITEGGQNDPHILKDISALLNI